MMYILVVMVTLDGMEKLDVAMFVFRAGVLAYHTDIWTNKNVLEVDEYRLFLDSDPSYRRTPPF